MIRERIEHPGARVVTLGGDLSILRARELKELLQTVLKEGEQVVLEFDGYAGADLSFFQLLCSAHRTAARLGVSLKLGSTVPARFLETADEAGYLRDKCCAYSKDKTCLWLRSCGE